MRNVRDNVAFGDTPSGLTHRVALTEYQARGVRWLYVLAPGQVDELVASDYPAPYAVETHNEWDAADPAGFADTLRAAQPDLYSKVKAKWPDTVVLGPALANSDNASVVGDLRPNLDAVNLHTYRGPAATPEFADNYINRAAVQPRSGATGPGRLRWITESGYANGDDTAAWTTLLSAARLIPRAIMTANELGVDKFFVYELLDQFDPVVHTSNPSEDRFGLYRHDLSRKPVADVLSGLLRLLADPGPGFVPTGLMVAESGSTAGFQSRLFQKRDGSYYLAFWHAQAVVTNPGGGGSPQQAGTDLPDINATVTLAFGQAFNTLEVYRPLTSTQPVPLPSGSAATVSSQLDIQLLRMT